jgi:hypothetical protein
MAKITPDQALLASYKVSDGASNVFVARVMKEIKPAAKMNNFFESLRHVPKFALVIAAAASVIIVSGTAYAAYQLWLKPSASVQHFGQNQEGRNEALVAFRNCQGQANTKYEVKSGADLNAEQIEQLMRARCEMDAINKWAYSLMPTQVETPAMAYPGAFTITKINGNNVTLKGELDSPTLTANDTTAIIVDGMPTALSNLKVGDTVTYVEYNTYNPGGGHPTSRTLMGIVKLQMPVEFYDNTMQNMVAVRIACYGNTSESCVQSGSIDVYPRDGENNMAKVTAGDHYEVQGRIIAHDGKTVRIKASSGAVYTINAPIDMVTKFNTQNSSDYGVRIETGDMLMVLYTKKSDEDPKTIESNQLRSVSLLIEVIRKQDPLKKY